MASMEGLAPDFQARLNALIAASGGRITLTSGFRTRAQQAALYKKKPKLAAKPGRSNHEKGEAGDIAFKDDNARKWAHANAKRFGLHFPMSHEPWHIERIDLKSKKGAYTKPWMSDGEDVFAEGDVLTPAQIAKIARQAGFTGEALVTAVAVGLAESRGRAGAIGDTTLQTGKWGPSVGIWQVRSLNAERGRGSTRDQMANLDPISNAKNAFQISGGGRNFKPWSVYTKGTYRGFLDDARQAVTQASMAPGIGAGAMVGMGGHAGHDHDAGMPEGGGDAIDQFASSFGKLFEGVR